MNKFEHFEEAQKRSWPAIIYEMKRGYKRTLWMSYVFPVLKGLDFDNNSSAFTLENIEEAKEYLNNEYLMGNLKEIINILMSSDATDPYGIFNFVDAEKLQASMTLFYNVNNDDIFLGIINKFFDGQFDLMTEKLLNN